MIMCVCLPGGRSVAADDFFGTFCIKAKSTANSFGQTKEKSKKSYLQKNVSFLFLLIEKANPKGLPICVKQKVQQTLLGKQTKEQVIDILNFSYEKYLPHPVLYSL